VAVLWMLSSIHVIARFSCYLIDDSSFHGLQIDTVTYDVHNPIGVVFVFVFFYR
jgi:hypothetical protein